MRHRSLVVTLSLTLLGACRAADSQPADSAPAPPVAAKKPFDVVAPHGAARQDEVLLVARRHS